MRFLGQFTVNERCTEFIYNRMTPETKKSLSSSAQFGITLGSGIIAGFAAAVLSHVSSLFVLKHIWNYLLNELPPACRYSSFSNQQGTWTQGINDL